MQLDSKEVKLKKRFNLIKEEIEKLEDIAKNIEQFVEDDEHELKKMNHFYAKVTGAVIAVAAITAGAIALTVIPGGWVAFGRVALTVGRTVTRVSKITARVTASTGKYSFRGAKWLGPKAGRVMNKTFNPFTKSGIIGKGFTGFGTAMLGKNIYESFKDNMYSGPNNWLEFSTDIGVNLITSTTNPVKKIPDKKVVGGASEEVFDKASGAILDDYIFSFDQGINDQASFDVIIGLENSLEGIDNMDYCLQI